MVAAAALRRTLPPRRFGAPAPAAYGATTAFGQQPAASAFGGGAFAVAQPARPGTGQPPYAPTKDQEQNTSGKRMEMVRRRVELETTGPRRRRGRRGPSPGRGDSADRRRVPGRGGLCGPTI